MSEEFLGILNETSKILNKVYDETRGSYEIYQPEVRILCPENIQKISIPFEAKAGKIPRKIEFPYGDIIRVNLRPFRGGEDLNDSIVYKDEGGFYIKTKNMQKHDLFILDVEYEIKSKNYLDSIVERNRSREVPNDEEYLYWMHATLKHPSILNSKYAKLVLEDLDFNIDVAVSQDIDTTIPKAFRDELDITIKLIKEKDRNKIQSLMTEKMYAQRRRGKKKDIFESLDALQDLFIEKSFKNFFEVKKDFRYHECHRGSNYHDNTPLNLTWPKSMKIVSRCDLSLEQCAAWGFIQYRRSSFLDEVKKII